MRSGWTGRACAAAIVLVAGFANQRGAKADEVWQPLAGGMDGPQVWAVTEHNGDLIAGGGFITAGGVPASRIARWNGSTWQPLGSGIDGGVFALTVYNGELIAGGGFDIAGGAPANNIARWNGTSWQPLGSGTDHQVYALAVYNGELIVGGAFDSAGGVPANRIARWDGASWHGMGTLNTSVNALTVYKGALVAGLNNSPGVVQWDGSSWVGLGSGVSGLGEQVFALTVYGDELIVGGWFLAAGGVPANRIARWNGATWQALGSGVSHAVYALTAYNGELIAGGSFLNAGGVTVNRIARWNGLTWQPPLGTGMSSTVRALATWNGALIAGGLFLTAGGQTVNGIALSTANSTTGVCGPWQPLGDGMENQVHALTTYNGELISGGWFTSAGGQPANYIARWDGSIWQPLGSGVNNWVFAFTVFEGELIAGGWFLSAGGIGAKRIARWNGARWAPLGGGMVGSPPGDFPQVLALTTYNGELVAGGLFTSAGGVSANSIARWDGSTWQPLGAGIGGNVAAVNALAVYGSELIAGGNFTFAGGVPANYIARWNGSSWEALGDGMDHSVSALTVYNGELIAGGHFDIAGRVTVNGIARWNGSTWQPLGSGINGVVHALTVYNGELIAGGDFTFADGLPANRIARWNGSTWQPLGSGTTVGTDPIAVYALTEHNAALIAGGTFSMAGGVLASRVARWSPNLWTSADDGLFGDNQNWSSPFAPDSPTTFGSIGSASPFTVTFSADAQSSSLCITNQRPVFDLNGSLYDVTNYATVGGVGTGHLSVNDGTLFSPITGVGSFGTLGGDGEIIGNVFNVGVLRPGGSPTFPGTLTLTGDYEQTFGTFNPIIGPASHGQLDVSNTASIAGTLKVDLTGGPRFQAGQQYSILDCATLNGTFGAAVLPFIGEDLVMNVQYNTGSAADGDEEGAGGGSGGGPGGQGVVIVIGQPGGNPDFDGPDTFTLEGEPTGVTGAGISGLPAARDLALSVAALSPNDPGNVLVLLNEGDGTSFDPVVEPVGREPSDIVAADLADSGGDDDLAVPNKGDDNVSILFHDGGGSFTTVNVPVGDGPSAIAAGLLNGDGLVDLAVTNSLSHTVTLLFNNGNRTFTPGTPIPVGNSPSAIAIDEIDGVIAPSGGPDIVVANAAGNSMMFIRNFGPGGFGGPISHPTGPTPSSVEPADLDNDKDVDIMLGCSGGSGSVTLFINSGGGVFGSAVNLPVDGTPAQSPGSLTHWDMDADQDEDVVVVVNDDTLNEPIIRILRNDSSAGQIAFTLFNPIGAGEEPRLVAGADVTGDLAEDLIAVNVQQLTLAGPPASSLAIRPNISGKAPNGPGDINGDGVVNIIDLLGVIASWGPCPPPCSADVYPHPSGDGIVNIQDLLFVIANWG